MAVHFLQFGMFNGSVVLISWLLDSTRVPSAREPFFTHPWGLMMASEQTPFSALEIRVNPSRGQNPQESI